MSFSPDPTIPPDGVPADRVLELKGIHRFFALDLADPAVQEWTSLAAQLDNYTLRSLCYNKTQPDRVCPRPECGLRYLPLPESTPAGSPGLERVEEERRMSGLCSVACFREVNGGSDDDFGRTAVRGVFSPSAGVTVTRSADGSVTTRSQGAGGVSPSTSTVSAAGTVSSTTLRECSGCGSTAGAAEGPGALSLCSACRQAAYCSPACQRAHWPTHKPACRAGKEVLDALRAP